MKFQESESIELKRILNDTFEKALVAFLNTMDGVIYIGVDDDGNATGVADFDGTLKKIADIVTTQILPNPQNLVEIGSLYADGKSVVSVKVKKGSKLYYIKKYGRSAQGCYIRMGTSCRSMTEEQIERGLINSLPSLSIADKPVLRDDFTFLLLKTYLTERGVHVDSNSLKRNFNLVTADGKYNMLAELLADNNYVSIKVAVFKGKDKSIFLKRNEYGNTCLIHALKQVISYCESLNDTYVDVSVRPRLERRRFSDEAFEEAWINACVHNKWIDGLPPAVYIFEDRIEIVSYGGIPKGLSKDEFLAGKTAPVNKELMNIFLQCGVVEQSGHGVPIVVREYGTEAYQFFDDMITVRIPFAKTGVPIARRIEELSAKSGEINLKKGTMKSKNSEINSENGTIKPENGTINSGNGTIKPENGTINSESGTINSGNGTINPEDGTIKPESGTIKPESGTIKPESGTINPENGTVKPENGTINSGNGTINLEELSEHEQSVFNFIRSDIGITRAEISKELSLSLRTVARIINSLKEKGYIKGRSSNKGGYWIL